MSSTDIASYLPEHEAVEAQHAPPQQHYYDATDHYYGSVPPSGYRINDYLDFGPEYYGSTPEDEVVIPSFSLAPSPSAFHLALSPLLPMEGEVVPAPDLADVNAALEEYIAWAVLEGNLTPTGEWVNDPLMNGLLPEPVLGADGVGVGNTDPGVADTHKSSSQHVGGETTDADDDRESRDDGDDEESNDDAGEGEEGSPPASVYRRSQIKPEFRDRGFYSDEDEDDDEAKEDSSSSAPSDSNSVEQTTDSGMSGSGSDTESDFEDERAYHSTGGKTRNGVLVHTRTLRLVFPRPPREPSPPPPLSDLVPLGVSSPLEDTDSDDTNSLDLSNGEEEGVVTQPQAVAGGPPFVSPPTYPQNVLSYDHHPISYRGVVSGEDDDYDEDSDEDESEVTPRPPIQPLSIFHGILKYAGEVFESYSDSDEEASASSSPQGPAETNASTSSEVAVLEDCLGLITLGLLEDDTSSEHASSLRRIHSMDWHEQIGATDDPLDSWVVDADGFGMFGSEVTPASSSEQTSALDNSENGTNLESLVIVGPYMDLSNAWGDVHWKIEPGQN